MYYAGYIDSSYYQLVTLVIPRLMELNSLQQINLEISMGVSQVHGNYRYLLEFDHKLHTRIH